MGEYNRMKRVDRTIWMMIALAIIVLIILKTNEGNIKKENPIQKIEVKKPLPRTKVVLAQGSTRSEKEIHFIQILNNNPEYHHIAEYDWVEDGVHYKRVTLHKNPWEK